MNKFNGKVSYHAPIGWNNDANAYYPVCQMALKTDPHLHLKLTHPVGVTSSPLLGFA